MRQSVREAFITFTSPLEGVVAWMYLDVLGLVTTGIGNLADPMPLALGMPWVRPDGLPAPEEEIAEAWRAVKSHPELAKEGCQAAARYTDIRLTPAGVHDLVLSKLDEMARRLVIRFPSFETWPADAQLGVLSMAWACGPAFNFPRLAACLRAQDFGAASMQCTINEQGNAGVHPRNKANQLLFRNAGCVLTEGLDPSVLYWPRDLAGEPDTERELANPPSDPPPPPTTAADMPTVYPKPEDGK